MKINTFSQELYIFSKAYEPCRESNSRICHLNCQFWVSWTAQVTQISANFNKNYYFKKYQGTKIKFWKKEHMLRVWTLNIMIYEWFCYNKKKLEFEFQNRILEFWCIIGMQSPELQWILYAWIYHIPSVFFFFFKELY